MSDEACVVVFTKPAVPGRVKTRLIGALTAEQAASLHAAFLDDVLEQLDATGVPLRIAWALLDGEPPPETRYPAFAQRGASLGDRLFHGLTEAGREAPIVVAVGSDHPEMPGARVREAVASLAGGADVVIGPAVDGGYYLIALRSADLDRRLFEDIPWSTSGVLDATERKARELQLEVRRLEPGHDVDTSEDLERLTRHLARHPDCCPRTREVLASWGRPALR